MDPLRRALQFVVSNSCKQKGQPYKLNHKIWVELYWTGGPIIWIKLSCSNYDLKGKMSGTQLQENGIV